MKQCNKCKISKNDNDFHQRIYKNGTIALQPTCKQCKKVIGQERYINKKQHILEVNAEWRYKNAERMNELRQSFKDNNGWYRAHGRAMHRARKINAVPEWADIDKIKEVYFNRSEDKVVDHIIPLNSDLVCGLHVHYNLQYLTQTENSFKGNKF